MGACAENTVHAGTMACEGALRGGRGEGVMGNQEIEVGG